MKRIYGKLIRDRIPEIIAAQGKAFSVSVLAEDAYREALVAKLLEEANEVKGAMQGGDRDEIIKELADLSEVMDALLNALGISEEEIRGRQRKRREERGGFKEHLWLEWVEEPEPPDEK